MLQETLGQVPEIVTNAPERQWWIIGVMLLAGIVGGVVNYLREAQRTRTDLRPDSETPLKDGKKTQSAAPTLVASLGLHIGLSMIAVFMVPLFLGMIQSELLKQVMTNGSEWFQSLMIFMGFCLAASMTSITFITTVSDRVLRLAQEAKNDADEAKDTANQAIDEVYDQLEEDDQETEEPITQNLIDEELDLNEKDTVILKAFSLKPHVRRSVSGIYRDVALRAASIDRQDIRESLSKLEREKLVVSINSQRDHKPRYKLSNRGFVELNRLDE